ncbi:MAG TPA: hypothetical protein IAC88_06265 [Candidatus Onthosoma merdavium]|nr:hypothetical protein [Candidatus Onthosoma merdavium]
MNTMRESKAFYKKMMMILLVGIMGIGVVGCGNSDTKEETPKDNNMEESTEGKEEDSVQSTAYLPTTEMSEEETKRFLTAGITISADELKALPDEHVLDDAELAVVYCYHNIKKLKDGTENEYYPKMAQPRDLLADGTDNIILADTTYFIEFTGIEIVNVEFYDVNEQGQYEKYVKIEENIYESAGPVLSEEKIKQLEENKQ